MLAVERRTGAVRSHDRGFDSRLRRELPLERHDCARRSDIGHRSARPRLPAVTSAPTRSIPRPPTPPGGSRCPMLAHLPSWQNAWPVGSHAGVRTVLSSPSFSSDMSRDGFLSSTASPSIRYSRARSFPWTARNTCSPAACSNQSSVGASTAMGGDAGDSFAGSLDRVVLASVLWGVLTPSRSEPVLLPPEGRGAQRPPCRPNTRSGIDDCPASCRGRPAVAHPTQAASRGFSRGRVAKRKRSTRTNCRPLLRAVPLVGDASMAPR